MVDPKEVICLSSDSDSQDEDNELLFSGSYLNRRRPPAAVVSKSSRSAPSQQSFTVQSGGVINGNTSSSSSSSSSSNTGRHSLAVSSPGAQGASPSLDQRNFLTVKADYSVKLDDNDSQNGDEESVLEVLPAQKGTPSVAAPSAGPRLSFSGQKACDPVVLMGSDDDEALSLSSSPGMASLHERLKLRMKDARKNNFQNEPVPVKPAPTRHRPTENGSLTATNTEPASSLQTLASKESLDKSLECLGDHHSDLDQKPGALLATVERHLDRSDSQEPDSIANTWQSKTQWTHEFSQSSLLSSSDSDDDSFMAKCRAFEDRHLSTRGKDGEQKSSSRREATTASNRMEKENSSKSHTHFAGEKTAGDKRALREKREAERREAKEQKEREKRAAREKRQLDRLAKQQAKEQAKRQRQIDREKNSQARGRFASQEIAVLAEPSLLGGGKVPWKILETLSEAGFPHVRSYPSGLSCNVLQFIRKNYLEGGAEKALEHLLNSKCSRLEKEAPYEHINAIAVIVDAETLIDLIQVENDSDSPHTSSSEGDDYPKLQQWLFGLVTGWRAAWHKTMLDRPRIILVLYKIVERLDRLWVQYNSRGRHGPTPPTTEQFHDAVLWMQIQFQIESILCNSRDDVCREIFKMTRFLAQAPYTQQATELQTFAKLPSHVSDMAPELDRARDAWIRQLQQIPRVSADMARNVSKTYPTALSLWKVYQDKNLSDDQKRLLLENEFGTKTSQAKLSGHVFRVLTSDNPNELLR
jgi:hypothetical protein